MERTFVKMGVLAILLLFLTVIQLASAGGPGEDETEAAKESDSYESNKFQIKVKDGNLISDVILRPREAWATKGFFGNCVKAADCDWANGECTITLLHQPKTSTNFPLSFEVGIFKKNHTALGPYDKILEFKFNDEDFEAWKTAGFKDLNVQFHKKANGDKVPKGQVKIDGTDRVIQGVVPVQSELAGWVPNPGFFDYVKKTVLRRG